ncbi:MAG TPA: hypothetical protein PK825_03590, partial [Bacteroidales bacterium]|nr:hypothetical protein [Bacteroidales bacterium]
EFLQKGENAVKNLAKLFIHYHNEKELMEGVRMLRAFLFIKKWYLTSVIELFLRMFQPLFLRNLNGKNPFLLFYDMIRLSWLIREIRNLKRFPV